MDLAWNDYIAFFFLTFGTFFALTGCIGIIRMPDFYSRIHPAGKSDSLGLAMIMVGLAFLLVNEHFLAEGEPFWSDEFAATPWAVFVRILMIILIVIITAPTATHAITKAAHLEGLEPWTLDKAQQDLEQAQKEEESTND